MWPLIFQRRYDCGDKLDQRSPSLGCRQEGTQVICFVNTELAGKCIQHVYRQMFLRKQGEIIQQLFVIIQSEDMNVTCVKKYICIYIIPSYSSIFHIWQIWKLICVLISSNIFAERNLVTQRMRNMVNIVQ